MTIAEHQEAKVALVTGASKNIGRAIAQALAIQSCHVVIHAAQDESGAQETLRLVESAGVQGMVVLGDLSRPETSSKIISDIIKRFGQLDILVNNAAVRPETPFSEMSFEQWREVMSICLDANFLMTKAALKLLQKSKQGSIVNIGGLTAHTGASDRVHVISAKSGVVGLTKGLAHELSSQGITVNCVSPGLIETIRADKNKPKHHDTRTNLVNRRGLPEEVAEAVVYLTGPGSRYITGQTIHVNGGAFLA